MGVVKECQIQHDEHKGPDVVNTDSLSMEGDDGVSVEPRGVRRLSGHRVGRSVVTEEETLSSGHLRGQGSAHSALVLPGQDATRSRS